MATKRRLIILQRITGRHFCTPFIGGKLEVRKLKDGILTISNKKSDAIIKTDLEGRILWSVNLSEDPVVIEGVQFVEDRIIVNIGVDEWHDQYVVIDNTDGTLIQEATIEHVRGALSSPIWR